MVKITKHDNETIFEIEGLHKIWSLKSQLTIPNEHIISAKQDLNEIESFKGFRAYGTELPSVIRAGTFYQYSDRSAIFMDIVDKNKTIIVELKDEKYSKLIIEVENPEEAINLLSN